MAGYIHLCHFLILTTILISLLFKESHELTVLDRDVMFFKSCNATLAFFVTYGDSFEKCLYNCMYRSNCRLLMFHQHTKECALIDTPFGDITFRESETVCIYARADTPQFTEVCNSTERFDASNGRCIPSECLQPDEIKDAALLSKTTRVGSTSRYKCKSGYLGIGNPKIVCQSNRTWTPTNFSCNFADCPVPVEVENAHLLSTKTRLGSKVSYVCKHEYNLIGNPEINCLMNATWTALNFTCFYAYCPNPQNVDNAYLKSPKTSLGSSNSYICLQGYLGLGNPDVYCNLDASWTATNFSCEKLCSDPQPIENAQLVSINYSPAGTSLRIGTKLFYECNADFQSESNTTTNVCGTNAMWEERRVMCCMNGTVSHHSSCHRVYTTENVTTYQEAVETCRTNGMSLEGTKSAVYTTLQEKGKNPNKWVLYGKTKSVLQASLFEKCLQGHMTGIELGNFTNATYDDTMMKILDEGWNNLVDPYTVNYCGHYLVREWFSGEPSGQENEDCIINGPESGFKYRDVDCNFSNLGDIKKEDIGFSCTYFPPNV